MKEKRDICLIDMPFSGVTNPAVGISILKAEAQKAGISAIIEYGSLHFANYIGLEKYNRFQKYSINLMMAVEMIFEPFAGYPVHKDVEESRAYYTAMYPDWSEAYEELARMCEELKPKIELFLDEFSDRILAYAPKIVGCTYTLQQCNASLAMLRCLKQKNPELITIMGGSAVTANAGQALVDYMPQLDYAYTGESDDIFADASRLMMAGLREELYQKYPCILRKGGVPQTHVTMDMNKVAIPDYDDYFLALRETGMEKHVRPALLIEGSRGCWWGEKGKCRFCGLHSEKEVIQFRQKTADRVAQELQILSERYGLRTFMFTDCILSHSHIRELPELLKEQGYHLFAEVKSNMTLEQLEGLKTAGFDFLQPGIESLSDELLVLMHKGNRAIKHIEFLKHARIAGIMLAWNIMKGLPTERVEWYEKMLELIPLLAHLGPPNSNRFQYQRNSEFTVERKKYGVKVKPCGFYACLFLDNAEFIDRFAENFEQENPGDLTYFCRVDKAVLDWAKEYQSGHMLSYYQQGAWLAILDTRRCALEKRIVLDGIKKEICLQADQATSIEKIISKLQEKYPREEVQQCIGELKEQKLVVEIGQELLFLAIPRKRRDYYNEKAFRVGVIYKEGCKQDE